ncbi:hypothetical protein GQ457_09G014290 [Hibiscus cannabinus]
MESDGIDNGLISNQLSTEGSSFEALLDTKKDISNSKTKAHSLVPARDSVGISMRVGVWRFHCSSSSKQCWGQREMGFLGLDINFKGPTATIIQFHRCRLEIPYILYNCLCVPQYLELAVLDP